ncbi:MAG TPA: chemotaxis protein CheW, partial [Pseudomonas sp.]|nr:chemotaxis protein CheW [Pseudomonas sp.]
MADMPTPFQHLLELDRQCRMHAAGLPSQQEAVQTWGGIG